MTNVASIPKSQVPVGRVTIAGQTYDVAQHPEFVRFFFDLFKRIGGTSAMSNTDLEAAVQSVAAGEMLNQPFVSAQTMFSDVEQYAGASHQFADVYQQVDQTGLGDTTWQI